MQIQELLVSVNGAVEFLEALGFEFRFEEQGVAGSATGGVSQASLLPGEPGGTGAVEGFAVLPMGNTLEGLDMGWEELSRAMHGTGMVPPRRTNASNPAGAGAANSTSSGFSWAAAEAAAAAAAGLSQGAGSQASRLPVASASRPPPKMIPIPPTERNTQVAFRVFMLAVHCASFTNIRAVHPCLASVTCSRAVCPSRASVLRSRAVCPLRASMLRIHGLCTFGS